MKVFYGFQLNSGIRLLIAFEWNIVTSIWMPVRLGADTRSLLFCTDSQFYGFYVCIAWSWRPERMLCDGNHFRIWFINIYYKLPRFIFDIYYLSNEILIRYQKYWISTNFDRILTEFWREGQKERLREDRERMTDNSTLIEQRQESYPSVLSMFLSTIEL